MGNRVIINATITTEAPLSIKMPVAEGARENEFENFPVMTRGVDGDGNRLRTGFLPATTIRGFLRRAVTHRNMRKAAEEGRPYKLPQVYSEMIGQDAASEQQSDEIDLLALKQAGVVGELARSAKIIKSGELTRKVTVRGLGVTIGAKAMIEAVGGNVVIVEPVKPGKLVAKK